MTGVIRRSYSISRVLATRDKLIKACGSLIGQRMTQIPLAALVNQFTKALPKGIPEDLIRESLQHLAGQEFKATTLLEEAWRLAGNVERLQNYHAVPPWNRQALDEFVPVQVVAVFRQERDDKHYVELGLRSLAGSTAPMVLKKVWTPKFCGMLSRGLGFSRPWDDLRFDDPRQLVGLRFYVLIEQRLCGARPGFEKMWMDEAGKHIKPDSFYDFNRQLIKLRNRVTSQFPCPRKFAIQVPCHTCIVGLEDCPLAVHDKTFLKQHCHYCHRKVWFDPKLSTRMCIGCHERHLKGEL